MKPEQHPRDEDNRRWQQHVAPADWRAPKPKSRYHLVVIGGGTAGLVAAAGAAGLGARVALVERSFLGGDCLNFGCVPSKALISAARTAATVRQAHTFGVDAPVDVPIRFAEVMQRVRRRRADISPHDSAARFQSLGVDVFFGNGRFESPGVITVGDVRLNYRRALIATGARAARPAIPGLEQVDYLTNESLFSLTELPQRMAILGGGPIGVEMAQAFARLGSQVTLIEQGSRLLSKEDPEASACLQAALQADGVTVIVGSQVVQVAPSVDQSLVQITIETSDAANGTRVVAVDRLLVATGRAPNVQGLGLEHVDVGYDERRGILVDDQLRTTQHQIFAAGDVATAMKFTHHADFLARIVVQNSLFPFRAKASRLIVPRVTYCAPELAHVGLTPAEAAAEKIEIETYSQAMTKIDRAVVEDRTEGFVKIHVRRGSDRIVGATIVSESAGELIPQIVLAMQHKIGLKQLAGTMYPYPTQAEAIRKLGDAYQRSRLTPWVKRLMQTWLRWIE